MSRERYDYVIVGGGSAGCALANRLSADAGTSVLVLEAGRSDFRIDPFIHMPAALPFPIGNRLYDWKYETDPEPNLNDRRVFHARGKDRAGLTDRSALQALDRYISTGGLTIYDRRTIGGDDMLALRRPWLHDGKRVRPETD